jgi:Tol biopolymer transport system component
VLRIGDVERFFWDRVAWSPDGRRLAFTGEAGFGRKEMDIWTVEADGERLRRATRTGDALWPVWAPDGRSIVYARLEDPGATRTDPSTTCRRSGRSIPTARIAGG